MKRVALAKVSASRVIRELSSITRVSESENTVNVRKSIRDCHTKCSLQQEQKRQTCHPHDWKRSTPPFHAVQNRSSGDFINNWGFKPKNESFQGSFKDHLFHSKMEREVLFIVVHMIQG